MTVQELEDKVWALDGVRIVIRAASADKVGDYSHRRAAQENWRITQFLEKRIAPLVRGKEVIVLEGNGEEPHGRTLLNSIRGILQLNSGASPPRAGTYMTEKNGFTVEMVAGTLGVFALTECDSFGWKHVIIGVILALYVFQAMTRPKTRYESIVYCAVTSLVVLLVFGKPLDWFRDTHLRESVSRDVIHVLAWVTLLFVAWVVHSRVSRNKETSHEAD